MKEYYGVAVSAGIVKGKAVVIERRHLEFPRFYVEQEQIVRELRRFKRAVEQSREQVVAIRASLGSLQKDAFEVLSSHLLMMEDVAFVDEIEERIRSEQVNAEWALDKVSRELNERFARITDGYFRQRSEDVGHVTERVMANLCKVKPDPEPGEIKGRIVVTSSLSPGNLGRLLKHGVAGLAMDQGAVTSHTAIIAHNLGLPAVFGLGDVSTSVKDGDPVILDGLNGRLVTCPDPDVETYYERLASVFTSFERQLLDETDLPAVTADGVKVALLGNLDSADEAEGLLLYGAEGLALVRTELLYLSEGGEADEDRQTQWYRRILTAMDGRPATFRTLDVSADKTPPFLPRIGRESNPALGVRGIRYCMRHPEVFRTQLRALFKASDAGPLRILFPMITGAYELKQVLAFVEEVRNELLREGVPIANDIPLGAMIEVPSAAVTADLLARHLDFFSIGTNDLVQYALAVDRGNDTLREQCHPLHISILRLMKHIADAAAQAGIPVSLCGELGGEPRYTPLLIALGIRELGMSAYAIPHVKRMVRSVSLAESKDLLEEVLACEGYDEIEALIQQRIGQRFPELCLNRFSV